MKKTFLILAFFLILPALILTGCANKQTNQTETNQEKQAERTVENSNQKATHISAVKAYEMAKTKMNKLPNDAVLTYVGSMIKLASADGLARGWDVRFYSPSQDKTYLVRVYANKVEDPKESSDKMHKDALPAEWVDSYQVSQAVKDICANSKEEKYIFYVRQAQDKPKWSVTCFPNGQRKTLSVDGETGELLGL